MSAVGAAASVADLKVEGLVMEFLTCTSHNVLILCAWSFFALTPQFIVDSLLLAWFCCVHVCRALELGEYSIPMRIVPSPSATSAAHPQHSFRHRNFNDYL